jgi:hypothetical protein
MSALAAVHEILECAVYDDDVVIDVRRVEVLIVPR